MHPRLTPRPARRAAAALALAALCAACSADIGTVLEVTLTGVPATTERLEALVTVDGKDGKPTGMIAGRVDRFSVQLPVGLRGALTLDVSAFGPATDDTATGCLLADGLAEESLVGQPRLDLALGLQPSTACSKPTSPWDVVPSPASVDLTSIFVNGPGDVWVGGAGSKLFHRTSDAWSEEFTGNMSDAQISAVVVRGKSVAIVETSRSPSDKDDATMLYYRPLGGGLPAPVPVKGRINALALPPGALLGTVKALIAGDVGIQPWVPGQAPLMPILNTGMSQIILFSVHYFVSSGARSAVAVGRSGRIYLGGGGDPPAFGVTPEVSGTTQDLRSVWAVGPDDIWAVGDGPTILRYNGAAWRSVAAPTGVSASLRGVWAAGPNTAFAVGTGGTILRWDGTSWQRQASPTTRDLSAVSGVAAVAPGRDEVWAIGAGGTVLYLARP